MWNYRGAFIGVTFTHPASLHEHDESETHSLRIQPTPIRITRIILDFKHADVINPKPKTSWSTQCWNPIMSWLKESHLTIKIKAWVKVRDNHMITISDPSLSVPGRTPSCSMETCIMLSVQYNDIKTLNSEMHANGSSVIDVDVIFLGDNHWWSCVGKPMITSWMIGIIYGQLTKIKLHVVGQGDRCLRSYNFDMHQLIKLCLVGLRRQMPWRLTLSTHVWVTPHKR